MAGLFLVLTCPLQWEFSWLMLSQTRSKALFSSFVLALVITRLVRHILFMLYSSSADLFNSIHPIIQQHSSELLSCYVHFQVQISLWDKWEASIGSLTRCIHTRSDSFGGCSTVIIQLMLRICTKFQILSTLECLLESVWPFQYWLILAIYFRYWGLLGTTCAVHSTCPYQKTNWPVYEWQPINRFACTSLKPK